MPLTEEEKDIVSCFRSSGYQPEIMMVAIIDRLVAENEELKDGRDYFHEELKEAQSKLDAIKKAWEPFMKRREDIAKCFKRPLADDTGIIVENQYFEALDELIGGEE